MTRDGKGPGGSENPFDQPSSSGYGSHHIGIYKEIEGLEAAVKWYKQDRRKLKGKITRLEATIDLMRHKSMVIKKRNRKRNGRL